MSNIFHKIFLFSHPHPHIMQLKTILIVIITLTSLNKAISQSSKVIYLKAYSSLEDKQYKGGNILQTTLQSIDLKSFTNPIRSFSAKNISDSKTKTEASKIYRLAYNSGNLDEIISKLRETGLFEFIEPQPDFQSLYIPNDTLSQEENGGSPHIWGHDFPAAWEISKGDTNIVIGYVDTGIRFDHEDMMGNI